jgi:4-hydroxybenzoate polyprenyltransferase
VLEALLFSSLWVAAAAAALTGAASRALGQTPAAGPLLLAFGGTLAVYNLDRLRDLARDRASAPARSAFVERHFGVLGALGAAGAALGALGAWLAGPRAFLPLLAAAPLALAHRRLKPLWRAKALYVTAGWVLVVAGVPIAVAGARAPARGAAWTTAVLALAILANAIASNVRDAEAAAAVIGRERALGLARGAAALALLLALLAPAPVRRLAAVAGATLAAVACYRPGERYGLGVVDGALLAGGLAAWACATPPG